MTAHCSFGEPAMKVQGRIGKNAWIWACNGLVSKAGVVQVFEHLVGEVQRVIDQPPLGGPSGMLVH